MRPRLAFGVLLLLLLAQGGCPRRIAAHMRLGSPLALEVLDAEGGLRELGGQGPARLLVIWASWCARCPTALDEGARVAAEYGLLYAAVSVDADERLAREANRQLAVQGPALWDEAARASSLTGVRRVPTFLLVDEEGRLAGIFEGVELGTLSALRRATASMKERQAKKAEAAP
ncbi:MAG: TlpA disulfide reductase family protein [Deltaproteobacteria bacterium]|nr:TlpA disulfide reductase family protein [Deltaproteobacteria bacterium]